MRTCPDCQASLNDHAKFCDNCGLPIPQLDSMAPAESIKESVVSQSEAAAVSSVPESESPSARPGTCSTCGYVNVPGEMFCQNCGVQLAPVASTPPPLPTPESKPSPARGVALEGSPTVVCSHCGIDNKPEEAFCRNCGLQLSPIEQEPEEANADSTLPKMTKPMFPPVTEEEPEAEGPGTLSGKLVLLSSKAEVLLPQGLDELLIGRMDPVRDIYPDVDLTSFGGEKSGVSRLHARLVTEGLETFIEDLNSTNFTFLNRERLIPGQRYALKDGDEIRMGLLVFKYLSS